MPGRANPLPGSAAIGPLSTGQGPVPVPLLTLMPKRYHWPANLPMGLALGLSATLAVAATGPADDPWGGRLAVGQNADGRLELFKTDTEGALLHRWQKVPNGEWSPWSNLGGQLAPGLAVATNAEGKLKVFGVDKTRRTLVCIGQTGSNTRAWGDWLDLGGNLRSPVTVGRNLDGRLEVFAVDAASSAVKCIWQTNARGRLVSLGGPGRLRRAWLGRRAKPRWCVWSFSASMPATKSLVHCWQQGANSPGSWSTWDNLGRPDPARFCRWPQRRWPLGSVRVEQLQRGNGAAFAR